MIKLSFSLFSVVFSIFSSALFGQIQLGQADKFAQLDIELPTPNVYRTASGAPGPNYYQQKADYKINLTLNDQNQTITGDEVITYTNNSPNTLEYLWLQLDQNIYDQTSDSKLINVEKMEDFKEIKSVTKKMFPFEGGFNIEYIKSSDGKGMKFALNKTMLRIDPSKPLAPGQKISFSIKWNYVINDRMRVGGRSGYEYFIKEDNYIYTIAQFFPRMCVYSDVTGWQNKQFLGSGEFTLPFGDYDVKITTSSDHIIAATGELQNASSILSAKQIQRLTEAKTASKPIAITTQEEATEIEKTKQKALKTWHFKATNVRDFAFASSRKFIWDAQGVVIGGKTVLGMSYYPKESNPLWGIYSTASVVQTLKTYSKYTIDYPYPVAISVNSKQIGMEYPMICFNGGRCEEDGSYSEGEKYATISVIIHEVGHNFFPMIINSDERQWSWMDEGLNTFLQYLTEQEFERDYPSSRGPANAITDYMRGDKAFISPIMTNSESIHQFGNNAYGKPATALNILRETIMGRELFDFAFKTYCQRWKFKHPTPADFFRTMEDASAVDLDWFWRGWFFGTDFVDISLEGVRNSSMNSFDPSQKKISAAKKESEREKGISEIRNATSIKQTASERDPGLVDYYNSNDPNALDTDDQKESEEAISKMTDQEKKILKSSWEMYELSFKNKGGLVSPIIVKATFENGKDTLIYVPAEIWRLNHNEVSKVFFMPSKVVKWRIDPFLETADCELSNNSYPATPSNTKYSNFRDRSKPLENGMQRKKRLEEKK
jgi:Peptidase family M1 domain